MKKAQLDYIGIALGVVRLVSYAAVTVGAFGLIGVVGTSDLESEIGQVLHPQSWYFWMMAKYIAVIAVGACVGSSTKPLWRWIRRTNYFYELGKRTYNSGKLQEN